MRTPTPDRSCQPSSFSMTLARSMAGIHRSLAFIRLRTTQQTLSTSWSCLSNPMQEHRRLPCSSTLSLTMTVTHWMWTVFWTSVEWQSVIHGTKKCSSCETRYKLNYKRKWGSKRNTLTADIITSKSIILLHPHLGFTYQYLNLLWHQVCRAEVSL